MKLDELIILISNKLGENINQSQLADALGITRQTICTRIKNGSQVTVSEIEKVQEFFNIKLYEENKNQDNTIEIDYYNDVFASCGKGCILFSEEKTKLTISTLLINEFSRGKKYSMITASGDSMSPSIENGDKLIVEHWGDAQIQDNKIYVFCFNNEFFVKRLSKNLDEIIIKSDNPDYRTKTISGSTANELTVIGKIVGIIRTL